MLFAVPQHARGLCGASPLRQPSAGMLRGWLGGNELPAWAGCAPRAFSPPSALLPAAGLLQAPRSASPAPRAGCDPRVPLCGVAEAPLRPAAELAAAPAGAGCEPGSAPARGASGCSAWRAALLAGCAVTSAPAPFQLCRVTGSSVNGTSKSFAAETRVFYLAPRRRLSPVARGQRKGGWCGAAGAAVRDCA